MYHGKQLAWSLLLTLIIGYGVTHADQGNAKGNIATPQQLESEDHSIASKSKASEAAKNGAKQKIPDPLPAVFAEDLRYVPPYAYLAAVMRPAKMLELKNVKDIPGADRAGPIPIQPSDIERVVATIYPNGRSRERGVAFIVQLRTDVSRGEIVSWLSPSAKPMQQHNRIYVDSDRDKENLALGFPDDHTILISHDPGYVFAQVGSSTVTEQPPHPLATGFALLDPDSHVAAVVDTDKLYHFAWSELLMDKRFASMVPFLLKPLDPFLLHNRIQLGINLAKRGGLVLRVDGDKTQDAEQLGKITLDRLVQRVDADITAFHDLLGEKFSEQIQSVEQRVKALFAAITMSSDEHSCAIHICELPPAAEVLTLVHNILALYIQKNLVHNSMLRVRNSMRSVCLAIVSGHIIPRDLVARDGTPLSSWRVRILPFIEQGELYERFHLDEPWDSEHNIKLLSEMPHVYQSRGQSEPWLTSFQMVTGKGTSGKANTIRDIVDARRTLAHIDGPERMKLLAEKLGRDATTVSRQIAGLEKARLVKRSPCQVDGRATDVAITKAGRKLIERTIPLTLALRGRAMKGISKADRTTLANALSQMLSNLKVEG